MQCYINALAPATCSAAQLGLAGVGTGAPLVYVAAGPREVGLWDIEEAKCRAVLRCVGREEPESALADLPAALQSPPPRHATAAADPAALAAHLAVDDLTVPKLPVPG